jgi:chromosome segregation ATPase
MAWSPLDANRPRSDVSFDLPGGESTAAALRRAEQERDEARAELFGVRASLAELADEVEDLKATLAMRTGQLMASRRHVQQADAERDLARAEVESARQELDALRAREVPQ